MKSNIKKMLCFSSIEINSPIIEKKTAKSTVILNKLDGEQKEFSIILKYEYLIKRKYLPLIQLAFIMPVFNYGLFTKLIKLNFSICKSDFKLMQKLNIVFSRDIFVNKILRRRTDYILPEYLIDGKNIIPEDAEPKAKILPLKILKDENLSKDIDSNTCGVLSSGGKESLLTYAILKEIGCSVYPLYINESGGHWRTALPAFKYHKKNEPNTQRVWTNIDRFYNFMLDNLKFIRSDHRKVWADTYPIRLCIFPFYLFSLLPIFIENKIGNILIGSEFDDLRTSPKYLGIEHYFGIFDQHQDYDVLMNSWYEKRIMGLKQWSAVRNISGLIVERILVKQYPKLARFQRSCHSCYIENGEIYPCGKCSKCMGVLLFLLANQDDPLIMNFSNKMIQSFPNRLNPSNLRLDSDEKDHSFYLIGKIGNIPKRKQIEHVEKIHTDKKICDIELTPTHLRKNLLKIIRKYTMGYCELKNKKWISIDENDIII